MKALVYVEFKDDDYAPMHNLFQVMEDYSSSYDVIVSGGNTVRSTKGEPYFVKEGETNEK